MFALSDKALRASFVNASRKERADLTLPTDFDTTDWTRLDFFGWRDPKYARRAYVVVPDLGVESADGADQRVRGVLLRRAESTPPKRTQCSWCHDIRLPNSVVFYSAKLPGSAGRNGNTIGTLVCEDFQCSYNVRNDPPPAYEGYDIAAARAERIDELRLRVSGFVTGLTKR